MPTSYTVLDSGILLATIQTETHTENAKAIIRDLAHRHIQIVAPVLAHYEIVAVVRKWVYRELISPEHANRALTILLNIPMLTVTDDSLLNRAYEIATAYDRPTAYDSQYVAVAERYQCDFWTADERLFNALNGKFSGINWIGNWGTM